MVVDTGSGSTSHPAVQALPAVLTRQQAAQFLQISQRTLDSLLSLRQLKCFRIGKSVRIRLSDLQAFIQRDHVTQAAEPVQ